MPGSSICLSAGIATSLFSQLSEPNAMVDIAPGIQSGLLAGRSLLGEGFSVRSTGGLFRADFPVDMSFPVQKLAKELLNPDHSHKKDIAIQSIDLSRLSGLRKVWRIVDDQLGSERKILDFGSTVVRFGVDEISMDAHARCPVMRLGQFFLVDRLEMENLRSVRELIANYLAANPPVAPLSLAVFGPPGSGKSFAIKELSLEMVRGGLPAHGVADITFNLSQFTDAHFLASSLHRVRDIGAFRKCAACLLG